MALPTYLAMALPTWNGSIVIYSVPGSEFLAPHRWMGNGEHFQSTFQEKGQLLLFRDSWWWARFWGRCSGLGLVQDFYYCHESLDILGAMGCICGLSFAGEVIITEISQEGRGKRMWWVCCG